MDDDSFIEFLSILTPATRVAVCMEVRYAQIDAREDLGKEISSEGRVLLGKHIKLCDDVLTLMERHLHELEDLSQKVS